MPDTTDITIVIPVHNRAGIVERTLDSIEAQTLRPLRVVLVDNASTDGTPEVLRRRAAKAPEGIEMKVVEEATPGAAAARNRGLAEVDTEWTMFFDSDDTMEPSHCMRALECAAEADIVGWNVRYTDTLGHSSVKPFAVCDAQYRSLMHGTMATQRYMARTGLFRKAGGWNNSILYWDDIELGTRLLNLNPRLRHAGSGITVDVLAQERSITGTKFSTHIEKAEPALEAIERNLGKKGALWTDAKRAILAADSTLEGSAAGKELLRRALSRHDLRERLTLRAIYTYRRMGLRGAARIFRILL